LGGGKNIKFTWTFKIATAGSVDDGKSTLIGRL
jgi:sulfate adenylyltransferase subunit 1 (EFTu-like GTPase family)